MRLTPPNTLPPRRVTVSQTQRFSTTPDNQNKKDKMTEMRSV